MENGTQKRLDEMKSEVEKNITTLKINTTWLILERRKVASKQEASQLGMQIRKNRKEISEFETYKAFLDGFDGDFALLDEEAAKEASTKNEKKQEEKEQAAQ